MRLALLSNVTVDLLAGLLKKEHEVYLAVGFDTWQQKIMSPASGLYGFKPEAVVILLYADGYSDVWSDRTAGAEQIDEWCACIKAACENLANVPVFVSDPDVYGGQVTCGADRRARAFFTDYFCERIAELYSTGDSVYVLPVADEAGGLGREAFYSPKMWYMGSMPYSMKGLGAIASLINRYTGVVKGRKKKCLAVDLDNTLWGGVIGEDGVDGIVLSSHKEGARFYDTQRLIKKMKEQGVMLAILSKNNPEDVDLGFSHPDMVLSREDFVAEAINWEPKCDNIRNLAENLNIGLDSFVFLDDNPAEREQMKVECPEVAVIDFPKDSSLLPEVVAKAFAEYFFSLEVTAEDRDKTRMYRTESQRKSQMKSAASLDDYLKKLEMKLDFHLMKPEEEKRVVQLVNKTNQFNLTTKRYGQEEISELNSTGDIFTVHIADKYGDQGLASVLILRYEEDCALIDSFLMSCRVMGRKAENEIMACLREYLEKKGVNCVRGSYIKTAKNAPVAELYEGLGFAVVSGTAEEIGDSKEYEADVSSLPEHTGFFEVVTEGLA